VVRDMHFLRLDEALGDPALRYQPEEIPYITHTAVGVIQRRNEPKAAAWYREEFAPRVVALDGVLGIAHFSTLDDPGVPTIPFPGPSIYLDLLLLEGDAAEVTERRRRAVPHRDDTEILLDGAFELIHPLSYPFASALRESSLPQTVR
jgi:hypothetical protein